MLVAIVMAMVDVYPGMPALPTLPQLRVPIRDLLIALAGSALLAWGLSRWLPKTALYGDLVSQSVSGVVSVQVQAQEQAARLGQIGVALSVLRPGGKAQFGEVVLDVITQGEMLDKGSRVRIIGHSATEAIVEKC
jgi:membrane-bound serine protease (ClpP class)